MTLSFWFILQGFIKLFWGRWFGAIKFSGEKKHTHSSALNFDRPLMCRCRTLVSWNLLNLAFPLAIFGEGRSPPMCYLKDLQGHIGSNKPWPIGPYVQWSLGWVPCQVQRCSAEVAEGAGGNCWWWEIPVGFSCWLHSQKTKMAMENHHF